ncbi:hypothetical protein PHYPSEUDO_014459 [Phytophthora pseudosyringae]|uniref:Uncharacterized protein n=1 Tax=Phytophthora pseudosyringae TaxID=221518 RepID=A0A8T1W529_9STRA|nr:hypothetical protein PHYPSEUDO_014459 [Phytophthora pseudosyringae]
MAFQARWRELSKLGWTASKPTGLSNDYTYLKPGKKKKGSVCGQDYFVGEEALMRHLDRTDLAELRAKQQETAVARPSRTSRASVGGATGATSSDDQLASRSCEAEATGLVTSPPTHTEAANIQGVSPHDPTHRVGELSEDEASEHGSTRGTKLELRGLLSLDTDMVFLYAMLLCPHLKRGATWTRSSYTRTLLRLAMTATVLVKLWTRLTKK